MNSHKVIGLAFLAMISIMSRASAAPCGDQYIANPRGGTIVVASNAQGCDRHGQRAGHNGPNGRYFIGQPAGYGVVVRPQIIVPSYYEQNALVGRHISVSRQESFYRQNMSVAAPSSGPAPVSRGTAQSCPRVTDARQVRNTSCRPHDLQLSWHGQSNYCLPPSPSPNAYPCHNQKSGHLAWFTP